MKHQRVIICEGYLPGMIALLCVPLAVMLIVSVLVIGGWRSFTDSTYFGTFGYFIYVIFYGSGLYAAYEFADTIRNRKTYVIATEEFLQVFSYERIRISRIRKIYIQDVLILRNLVIVKKNGKKTKIRSYMVNDDLAEVRDKLIALTSPPQRRRPPRARKPLE